MEKQEVSNKKEELLQKIIQAKAIAYDCLAAIETAQRRLQQINQELVELSKELNKIK